MAVGGAEMADCTFEHYNRTQNLIGSGQYKFRPYVAVGTLSAPQNPSLAGSMMSWDKVDSAGKYEIFADNASIGEVDK